MKWQALQAHMLIGLQTALGSHWDSIAIGLSFLGNYSTYRYLVIGLVIVVGTEYALETGIIALLAMISADALKLLFLTKRPFETHYHIRSLYTDSAAGASFPSGHAEVATAVYALFAHTMRIQKKRWWWLWLLIPLFIGISRLYLGVHWPIDVVSGWIFGWMLFELTILRPGYGHMSMRFGILSPVWWMIILLLSNFITFGPDTVGMLRFVAMFSLFSYFTPPVIPARSLGVILFRAGIVLFPMWLLSVILRYVLGAGATPIEGMVYGAWLGLVGFVFPYVKI